MNDIFVKEINVDLWKTQVQPLFIGIKQHEEWMAKERQFTRDMKIFGEIKEKENNKEEVIGYVGYRKSLWDDEPDVLKRRLVIKLFSKSMYHQATIEEIVGREVFYKIATPKQFPSFTIILKDFFYLVNLSKVRGGKFVPEWFSFRLDNGKLGFFPIILKTKFRFGHDFRIIKAIGMKEIGFIDWKILDIGGRFIIKLQSEDKEIIENKELHRILILFGSTVKFHEEIEKKVKNLSKQIIKGTLDFKLDNDELDLRMNPRSIQRK
jgi:hypothetical protein